MKLGVRRFMTVLQSFTLKIKHPIHQPKKRKKITKDRQSETPRSIKKPSNKFTLTFCSKL